MSAKISCRGYTLVELLVVLGIVSVMLVWVVPAMSHLIQSAQVNAGVQMFTSSLMLARSEAVKRNTRVVMCKSASGAGCETEAAWEHGWIVFNDANGNGLVDQDERVLHRVEAMPPYLRLRGNAPVNQYVLYTPLGSTKLLSGAFQAGTFTVCAKTGQRIQAKQVVLTSVGRVRVTNASLTQCA